MRRLNDKALLCCMEPSRTISIRSPGREIEGMPRGDSF
jgi:hypothetical protein